MNAQIINSANCMSPRWITGVIATGLVLMTDGKFVRNDEIWSLDNFTFKNPTFEDVVDTWGGASRRIARPGLETNNETGIVRQSLLVYTPLPLFLAQPVLSAAVSETNEIYQSSGIPIILAPVTLIRKRNLPFSSSSSYDTLLALTQMPRRGHDLVVGLFADLNTCGRAFQDCQHPECAFAIVDISCLGAYTLPHELGHIQGANHNREATWPNTVTRFNNAYGTVVARFWRTIMAYSLQNERRLPFFSNGTRPHENNAWVISQTRLTISKYGRR